MHITAEPLPHRDAHAQAVQHRLMGLGAGETCIDRRGSASVHLGYLDMVALTSAARLVLTDSGGLQKEAYWLGVPCLTMRDETEWVETVEAGWNALVGSDSKQIAEAVHSFTPNGSRPALYGDGFASSKCVDLLG